MSSLSVAIPTEKEVAERFAELTERWRRETGHLSSTTEIVMHPAYQQIIGLGRLALPLILRELARGPGHWDWALSAITGEDPVKTEDAGNMEVIREKWLRLADERGWLNGG